MKVKGTQSAAVPAIQETFALPPSGLPLQKLLIGLMHGGSFGVTNMWEEVIYRYFNKHSGDGNDST